MRILSQIFIVSLAIPTLAFAGKYSDGNYAGWEIPKSSKCKDYVVLNYGYGSEKASWNEEVIKTFNNLDTYVVNDTYCVRVNTQSSLKKGHKDKIFGAMGSGKLMRAAEARSDLHIVSPASSLFVNKYIYDNKGNDSVVHNYGSIVRSPLVFAMWDNMDAALRKAHDLEKDDFIEWDHIINLVKSPNGWSSLGDEYTQWGQMKYQHTSPKESNSGLMAVAIELAAANKILNGADLEDELTLDIAKQPAISQWVNDLEKASERYGSSTGFLAKDMVKAGPGEVHVAVLYENLIIEQKIRDGVQNASWNTSSPKRKLVAAYPEGTFESDHPLALVTKNTDDIHKKAAKMFFDYMYSKSQQELATQYGFRPSNTDAVKKKDLPDALFSTEYGIIKDLGDAEPLYFPYPEGDVISFIVDSFWQTVKKASNTVLVFDVSGSMGYPVTTKRGDSDLITEAKVAARSIVNNMFVGDSMRLLPFNNNPKTRGPFIFRRNSGERLISQDRGAYSDLSITHDLATLSAMKDRDYVKTNRAQLLAQIEGLSSGGGTRFIDTVPEAYDLLCQKANSADQINSIIVLSDGVDTHSENYATRDRAPNRRLLNAIAYDPAKSCNVFIYTIFYKSDLFQSVSEIVKAKKESGASSSNVQNLLAKFEKDHGRFYRDLGYTSYAQIEDHYKKATNALKSLSGKRGKFVEGKSDEVKRLLKQLAAFSG